jgi:hypothetical protein
MSRKAVGVLLVQHWLQLYTPFSTAGRFIGYSPRCLQGFWRLARHTL